MSKNDKPLPFSFLFKQEEDAKRLDVIRNMTKAEFDAMMAKATDEERRYNLALIECGQFDLLDQATEKTKEFPQVKKLLDKIWKESDNA